MILHDIVWALSMGLAGALLFSAIGLVSGTDETATIAPLTLLVVLLGVPPVGVTTFFMAAVVSKHMTHAVPTTLLGIPGDTTAVPLLEEATQLRRLGVPHIALRKAISSAVVSALIAVPVSVGFATLLAPFADQVGSVAPYLFLGAAVMIAYFSPGRWASIAALVPFAAAVVAFGELAGSLDMTVPSISFFLGIAVGPLAADLFTASSRQGLRSMRRSGRRAFWLAPEVKAWSGYFPNPFTVLTRREAATTATASVATSLTFMFSPVAMTVLVGEVVKSRMRHGYQRLSSVIAAKNGVTESTYIGETLIPLVAFGLPLSPMAAGPAAPLFNAPPVFTVDTETGTADNLHSLLEPWQFLVYSLLGVVLAALVAYPFTMNYARRASAWVISRISHEALIGTFAGLIVVIAYYEAQWLGVVITLTVACFGGLLNRFIGMTAGVQFMGYYVAVLSVPALLAL